MTPPDAKAKHDDAVILDWHGPFSERVMERLHEYDDNWPKPTYRNTVVRFPTPPVEGA